MKFKKVPITGGVYSSDMYYDLFHGGYIKPQQMLEPEDAKRVQEAVATVMEFLNLAEKNGWLEVG